MLRAALLWVAGLLLCLPVLGQQATVTLSGRVTDAGGKPLPLVAICLKDSLCATATDAQGRYTLRLYPGSHQLVYEHPQHLPQFRYVEALRSQALPEVRLLAIPMLYSATGGQASATLLVRQAIQQATLLRHQRQGVLLEGYTRTQVELMNYPRRLGPIELTIGRQWYHNPRRGHMYLYQAEAWAQLYLRGTRPQRAEVLGLREAGYPEVHGLFGNYALQVDLYQPLLQLQGVTMRGLVSPLSPQAGRYYRFSLVKVEPRADSLAAPGDSLYHLLVQPRRPWLPALSGKMVLAGPALQLQSFHLVATGRNQLWFADTLVLAQTFVPLGPGGLLVPGTSRFEARGRFMKIRYAGESVTQTRSVQHGPLATAALHTLEVLRADSSAYYKGDNWWLARRPSPLPELAEKELDDAEKLLTGNRKAAYLDSLTKKHNRPDWPDLALGYTYTDYRRQWSFYAAAPITAVGINTMEGWHLVWDFRFSTVFRKVHRLDFIPIVRYGFGNQRFSYQGELRFTLQDNASVPNLENKTYLAFAGGDYVKQFGNEEQLGRLTNTLYTLFAQRSYIKLYQRSFARASAAREILNGVWLTTSLTYENRRSLPDVPVPHLTSDTTGLTPNIPTPAHQVLLLEGSIRYEVRAPYGRNAQGKVHLPSRYPTVALYFRKGFPLGDRNSSDFELMRLEVMQNLNLGLVGRLQLMAGGGGFLSKSSLNFADYQHFVANQTIFRNTEQLNQFSIQDYYSSSTSMYYAEAHAEHHLRGWLLNKVPGLRRLKLDEIAGLHYLYTAEWGHYMELNVGLGGILRLLRVDFHYRLLGDSPARWGLTLGVYRYF